MGVQGLRATPSIIVRGESAASARGVCDFFSGRDGGKTYTFQILA